jgi:Flp pilus assembly protein TadG
VTSLPRTAHRTNAGTRSDAGQATVELALVLPLLMTFLLAGVQAVVVVRAQLAVTHAAREAARAASVSASPNSAAASAAHAAVGIEDLAVSTTQRNDRVSVTVRSVVPSDVPLVGALLDDITVTATATMMAEA